MKFKVGDIVLVDSFGKKDILCEIITLKKSEIGFRVLNEYHSFGSSNGGIVSEDKYLEYVIKMFNIRHYKETEELTNYEEWYEV